MSIKESQFACPPNACSVVVHADIKGNIKTSYHWSIMRRIRCPVDSPDNILTTKRGRIKPYTYSMRNILCVIGVRYMWGPLFWASYRMARCSAIPFVYFSVNGWQAILQKPGSTFNILRSYYNTGPIYSAILTAGTSYLARELGFISRTIAPS